MFSVAYVILPFTDAPPAKTIKASLAPFRRGGRGDLPESWPAFDEGTARGGNFGRRLTPTRGAGVRDPGLPPVKF